MLQRKSNALPAASRDYSRSFHLRVRRPVSPQKPPAQAGRAPQDRVGSVPSAGQPAATLRLPPASPRGLSRTHSQRQKKDDILGFSRPRCDPAPDKRLHAAPRLPGGAGQARSRSRRRPQPRRGPRAARTGPAPPGPHASGEPPGRAARSQPPPPPASPRLAPPRRRRRRTGLRRAPGDRGVPELLALLLGLSLAAAAAAARPAAGTGSPGGRRLVALLALLLAALGLAQDVEGVRLVVQQLVEAVGDGATEVLLHDGSHLAVHRPLHRRRGRPPPHPRRSGPGAAAAAAHSRTDARGGRGSATRNGRRSSPTLGKPPHHYYCRFRCRCPPSAEPRQPIGLRSSRPPRSHHLSTPPDPPTADERQGPNNGKGQQPIPALGSVPALVCGCGQSGRGAGTANYGPLTNAVCRSGPRPD